MSKRKRNIRIAVGIIAAYAAVIVLLLIAESGAPDSSINSVGDAIWYSIITLTTVGYGDISPVTPVGKVLGVILALCSLGLLTALMGILLSFISGQAMPRMRLKASRNSKWYVFNEMNEYVSSKYGIVRDKKSEVRQKKNGKPEPVKLGFTFSRSNDDKKKPSEPFSKTELRYKLMLENMERMGTMIMKHMEGGKNNEAIKGLQKQFKAVNDLFGTNIMTESPKLTELVNGQQNNIVNDNIIKKADTKIKLNK